VLKVRLSLALGLLGVGCVAPAEEDFRTAPAHGDHSRRTEVVLKDGNLDPNIILRALERDEKLKPHLLRSLAAAEGAGANPPPGFAPMAGGYELVDPAVAKSHDSCGSHQRVTLAAGKVTRFETQAYVRGRGIYVEEITRVGGIVRNRISYRPSVCWERRRSDGKVLPELMRSAGYLRLNFWGDLRELYDEPETAMMKLGIHGLTCDVAEHETIMCQCSRPGVKAFQVVRVDQPLADRGAVSADTEVDKDDGVTAITTTEHMSWRYDTQNAEAYVSRTVNIRYPFEGYSWGP
jgi:hypothetical protein